MRENLRRKPRTNEPEVAEQAHGYLRDLLADYQRKGVPVMIAYDRIAEETGESRAKIQRILGRRDNVTISAHFFINIKNLYEQLCDRVDARIAENEAIIAEAMRGADAQITAREAGFIGNSGFSGRGKA